MIVPIRCFNCGKVLADIWNTYLEKLQEKNNIETAKKEEQYLEINKNKNIQTVENEILNELGITKPCCRTVMLSTVDLTDKITN